MEWVYLAAGFTGALSLTFLSRQLFGSPGTVTGQVLFAPGENPLEVLRTAIQNARKEILVQTTMFSAQDVAEALVEAKLRGVTVELLIDLSQERDPSSVLPFLLDQGLAPLIDHENRAASTQLIIVDEHTVFTGGHALAPYEEGDNAEYMMVLPQQPALAVRFRQQFFLHREHGRAPQLRGRPTATTTGNMPTTPTPPASPPSTPPISETLARLLPGLKGVNLPSEADQENAA